MMLDRVLKMILEKKSRLTGSIVIKLPVKLASSGEHKQ